VIELRHSIRAAKLRVAYREASCRFSVRRPLDRGIAGPHAEGGREQATRHWLPAQDNSGVALESLQNQAHLQKIGAEAPLLQSLWPDYRRTRLVRRQHERVVRRRARTGCFRGNAAFFQDACAL